MTDGIRDALGMDSKNRENRDGETVVEASELRALRQQLHREREARKRAEQQLIDQQTQKEMELQAMREDIGALRERAERAERERDELCQALFDLLEEAKGYTDRSKHLAREVESAEKVLSRMERVGGEGR